MAWDGKLRVAVEGSVAVNLALLVLQLYTAISSGSLSLFATMADSFMDLLSGIILSVANRAAQRNNFFNYPTVGWFGAAFAGG